MHCKSVFPDTAHKVCMDLQLVDDVLGLCKEDFIINNLAYIRKVLTPIKVLPVPTSYINYNSNITRSPVHSGPFYMNCTVFLWHAIHWKM